MQAEDHNLLDAWAPPHDEEEDETLGNYTMATVGDEDDVDVSEEVRVPSSLTCGCGCKPRNPHEIPVELNVSHCAGLAINQDDDDDDDTDEVGALRVLSRQTLQSLQVRGHTTSTCPS